jgi:hypothetical protein
MLLTVLTPRKPNVHTQRKPRRRKFNDYLYSKVYDFLDCNAMYSYEKSRCLYGITKRYNSKHCTLHSHRCEDHNYNIFIICSILRIFETGNLMVIVRKAPLLFD